MKAAVYVEEPVEGFLDSVGDWRCYHDGQRLAVATSLGPSLWLGVIDLVQIGSDDGLRVYGLPERAHRHGRSRRGAPGRSLELVDPPPFLVYCPAKGCGRRQRVG